MTQKTPNPLASLGFSERDIERVKRLSEEVTELHVPAALEELDAPFRVSVVLASDRRLYSGRMVGRIGDKVVLVWGK